MRREIEVALVRAAPCGSSVAGRDRPPRGPDQRVPACARRAQSGMTIRHEGPLAKAVFVCDWCDEVITGRNRRATGSWPRSSFTGSARGRPARTYGGRREWTRASSGLPPALPGIGLGLDWEDTRERAALLDTRIGWPPFGITRRRPAGPDTFSKRLRARRAALAAQASSTATIGQRSRRRAHDARVSQRRRRSGSRQAPQRFTRTPAGSSPRRAASATSASAI